MCAPLDRELNRRVIEPGCYWMTYDHVDEC